MMSFILIAIGCASPGNPRPPSLNLPETVTDLSAQRIGDQVQLRWTTPSRTTDGLDAKGTLTADLCRFASPATGTSSCISVQRFPVHPGPSQTTDPLPASLTSDPASLLAYRIEIINVAGRSAGPSPQAFTAAGAAPQSVSQLHATATGEGAVLEWQPQLPSGAVSRIELSRTLTSPSAPAQKPAESSTGQPPALKLTPSPPAKVHLQPADTPGDAGGILDRTAHRGETYSYTAQRVRSVDLAGHSLELRSPTSSPVTLLLTDTFPPHTPTGLALVPSGANPTDVSIDLSWDANSETDLAGYIVYRQQLTAAGQPEGAALRLNTSPVVGPAFHDPTPVPGQHYAYRISAVDTAGNESRLSPAVQETPREQ